MPNPNLIFKNPIDSQSSMGDSDVSDDVESQVDRLSIKAPQFMPKDDKMSDKNILEIFFNNKETKIRSSGQSDSFTFGGRSSIYSSLGVSTGLNPNELLALFQKMERLRNMTVKSSCDVRSFINYFKCF